MENVFEVWGRHVIHTTYIYVHTYSLHNNVTLDINKGNC